MINISLIDNIKVLKDKFGNPINLKLTGKNFMIFYKFSFSRIDGVFGFGHRTNILTDSTFETMIHIPDQKAFAQKTTHTISYTTPFDVILLKSSLLIL